MSDTRPGGDHHHVLCSRSDRPNYQIRSAEIAATWGTNSRRAGHGQRFQASGVRHPRPPARSRVRLRVGPHRDLGPGPRTAGRRHPGRSPHRSVGVRRERTRGLRRTHVARREQPVSGERSVARRPRLGGWRGVDVPGREERRRTRRDVRTERPRARDVRSEWTRRCLRTARSGREWGVGAARRDAAGAGLQGAIGTVRHTAAVGRPGRRFTGATRQRHAARSEHGLRRGASGAGRDAARPRGPSGGPCGGAVRAITPCDPRGGPPSDPGSARRRRAGAREQAASWRRPGRDAGARRPRERTGAGDRPPDGGAARSSGPGFALCGPVRDRARSSTVDAAPHRDAARTRHRPARDPRRPAPAPHRRRARKPGRPARKPDRHTGTGPADDAAGGVHLAGGGSGIRADGRCAGLERHATRSARHGAGAPAGPGPPARRRSTGALGSPGPPAGRRNTGALGRPDPPAGVRGAGARGPGRRGPGARPALPRRHVGAGPGARVAARRPAADPGPGRRAGPGGRGQPTGARRHGRGSRPCPWDVRPRAGIGRDDTSGRRTERRRAAPGDDPGRSGRAGPRRIRSGGAIRRIRSGSRAPATAASGRWAPRAGRRFRGGAAGATRPIPRSSRPVRADRGIDRDRGRRRTRSDPKPVGRPYPRPSTGTPATAHATRGRRRRGLRRSRERGGRRLLVRDPALRRHVARPRAASPGLPPRDPRAARRRRSPAAARLSLLEGPAPGAPARAAPRAVRNREGDRDDAPAVGRRHQEPLR